MRGTTEQLDGIRKSRKFYTWRTESSSDVASLPWLSTEAYWDEEDDGRKEVNKHSETNKYTTWA